MDCLKQLSQLHYTIYDTFPNIIPNTDYIDLLPEDIKVLPPTSTISLFLGQYIFELDYRLSEEEKINKSKALTERIIKTTGAQYYFPHPREPYFIQGITYIATPLIFEDYLIAALRTQPDTFYNIYTFCSSVGLNVHRFPNVSVKAVRFSDMPEKLNPIYALFEKSGICIMKA